ncbi:Terpene cyclase [Mycena sanguinolenta]|uniref:Terpene synthase n=1 Tax=Mycena sanguinolenta TaxID=230812 RepID=A0A8H6XHJ9_9AGAR|nr:Terpene cyclase [Mycena sanguinolenta]
MDNLPQTFRFPPLNAIAGRFKNTDLHPMREQARTEALKWLSSYEGIDKRWLAILMQAGTDSMAALVYPDVDFDGILLTIKWFLWAWLIDDTVDGGFMSTEGITELVKIYEDVQLNRDVSERGELPLIIEIFRDVWNEVRDKKRPAWEHLFAEASIDYVRALPEVNQFRKSAKVPDIETYKRNRRRVVYYEAVFHWTGLIHGYLIAPDLIRSPEMKELYASLVEFGWLVNDIFSWNIDQRDGDFINIISLMMIHEKKTLQDAIDEAAPQATAQLVRWEEAKIRVFETYREHKDINELKALVEANERCIWLPIGWSWMVGERYFGSQTVADEAQSTGVVHVMPRRNKTTGK